MAGFNNFNLGNNLKLQQTQQLKATAKVDTQKAEGKNTGDAKAFAVFYAPKSGIHPNDYEPGDVIIDVNPNSVICYRITIDDDGTQVAKKIDPNYINEERDCEENRGLKELPW